MPSFLSNSQGLTSLILSFILGSVSTMFLRGLLRPRLDCASEEEKEEKKEEEELVAPLKRQVPDFMVDEYFSRMHSFLGQESFQRVRNAFVVVVCLLFLSCISCFLCLDVLCVFFCSFYALVGWFRRCR